MKAMILAAGLGSRMKPLTDRKPKPLLEVGGKALILHLIERLVNAGFTELLINVSWFGELIIEKLGDGSAYGASIQYSTEPSPLETAGGIVKALPMLGTEPFLVVNGDIWTDYDFSNIVPEKINNKLAHLIMVPNPAHNPLGDFNLEKSGLLQAQVSNQGYTFSGISFLSPELFSGYDESAGKLAPLLRAAMEQGKVSGELHEGQWWDVGTPSRLEELDQFIKNLK